MAMIQDLYSLISILNLFLAGAVIFLERRNAAVTWAWLLVLFFLPGLGFILYLILGQNLSKRKLYRVQEDKRQIVDTLVQFQKNQFRSGQIEYNDSSAAYYQDMIYMNLASSHALFTQDNKVDIFTDGNDKYQSLLQDVRDAKDHIHLMYFIVRNDELGRKLVNELARKADEGVEIRFLYDAIGSSGLPRNFFQSLREAGGEVAAFFPSRIPYLNLRVNYRNHRKLAIIDGTRGYIGGLNIGTEYLGLNRRFGYWRDTHLKLQGSAVMQLQAQFLLDWTLTLAGEFPVEARYFPAEVSEGQVGLQIVSSGPDNEWEQIKNAFIKMILAAKETVYIQTPYFIPDDSLLTALEMASLSGVDVKIMLPSKPDHKLVYWASYSNLREVLNCGAACYLYEKGFLHAKTIVVDGRIATVGTANMDNRSFKLNFEINAFIYDTTTASRLHELFLEDLHYSTELTKEMYNNRPLVNRFKESCARLLSPIL